jgi:hypothetical protein
MFSQAGTLPFPRRLIEQWAVRGFRPGILSDCFLNGRRRVQQTSTTYSKNICSPTCHKPTHIVPAGKTFPLNPNIKCFKSYASALGNSDSRRGENTARPAPLVVASTRSPPYPPAARPPDPRGEARRQTISRDDFRFSRHVILACSRQQ